MAGALQFRGFDPTTVDMARQLSAYGYRVINYDRRGRGESCNTASFTLADSIDDMPAQWLQGARQSPGWPVMTAMGPSLEADAEALAWTQSAPRNQLWAGITAPVLALIGQQSMPIMPPAALSIGANVPNGNMDSVSGENHVWDADVMAKRIADFLAMHGI